MDALGALSIASAIITFIDFGGKLISDTRKLYKSADGALSSVLDTEVVTSDLLTLTQGLRRKLPENRRLGQQYSLGGDDDDEALDKICVRCVALAEELGRRLNKLKLSASPSDRKKALASPNSTSNAIDTTGGRARNIVGGTGSKADESAKAPVFRKWESFRKALEAVWSRREIEDMAKTLRDLRDEMEFRILVSFRRSLQAVAAKQSDATLELEKSTQRIVETFLTSRDSFAGQLKDQSEKLIQIHELLNKRRVEDVQKLEDVTGGQLDPTGSFVSPSVGSIRQRGVLEDNPERKPEPAIEEKLCVLMTENEILGSLSFTSINTRSDTIDAAHAKTFRWVHEEPGSTERPWHNFVAWLRSGHGIYWLNGKLGSGKSTLMKYIYEHGKTRDELKTWSQGRPVEISGFFFWNSGDEDQKSQSGLLRSLLLQLLQRHRDMLEKMLPDMWSAYYTRARLLISRRDLPPDSPLLPPKPKSLTLPQLKQVFHDLVLALQGQVKLCFFIDGLDEYAGDYLEITEFFKQHANLPGVKLCISSRPLLVFEQAFEDLPGLRLQDLSKADIKDYVSALLYSHTYMKQLERRSPDEASRLVTSIVEKARGVFLWVKIVTRSLLRGLSDYNRISDLKKRVSHLPSDLEALYQHIIDNVDPFYRTQMSQIFQIFRVAQNGSPELVTLLNLSWADDEEELSVETVPIQPCNKEEIKERCEIMDARLKSVCMGLLETTDPKFSSYRPDCQIFYLHRTVYDWLAKPEVWERLASITAGSGFSPNFAMLKSRIMRLKTLKMADHEYFDLTVAVDALNYAREAEQDLCRGFPKLLDQLDMAAEFHWRNNGRNRDDLAQLHWSQFIGVPEGGNMILGQPCTFFDLAGAFGLTHYVDMKYDTAQVAVSHEVNHWLLKQAFSGTCESAGTSNRPKDPDPEQVQRILASGIDPNMSFDGGMTPWQGALLDAFWHLSRRPSPPEDPQSWRRKAQAWEQILEKFFQHGSDPHCPAVRHRHLPGFPRVTPRALVEAYSVNSLTEEAARLEECIASEIARRETPRNKKLLPALVEGPGGIRSAMDHGDPAIVHIDGSQRVEIIR
ncbi:hypothetical protein PG984_002822 [Apiospora sp. TS-2023a]